jgi:hypothetical protein
MQYYAGKDRVSMSRGEPGMQAREFTADATIVVPSAA